MRKICLLLISLLMISCSNKSGSSVFIVHEYDEVKDKEISYLDVFNIQDERYYLYYYQVNCYHCHTIKSRVIDFSFKSKIPFYFVRIEKDEGFLSHSDDETIGTNNPLEAFSMMTPQLSLVENGYVAITVHGTEEILLIIERDMNV